VPLPGTNFPGSSGGGSNMGVGAGVGLASGVVGLLKGLFGTSTSTDTSMNQNTSSTSTEDIRNLLNTLQQLQTQQQQSQQYQQGTSVAPAQQQFLNNLTRTFQGIGQPVNTTGYVQGQVGNINAASGAQSQQVSNEMAARGLSTSPVTASALAGVDASRIAQINQVQQQAPLLGQQLQLQNLGAATGFLNALPRQVIGTQFGSQTGLQTGQTQQTGQTTGVSTGDQSITGSTTSKTRGGGIFSDVRLKSDIREIPHDEALKKILNINPSTWKWKSDGSADAGMIAQDVQKIVPDAVGTDESTGYKKLDYAHLMPYIIASIHALARRNSTSPA